MSDLVPPSPPQDEATIPMASLAYALPTTAQARARPGLVTALGALDIVVGSLGLIASLATIAFAVTFYVAAKAADADIASRAAPSAPPAFLAPIGIAPAKIEVAPDGLADWPRRIAVEAVTSVHPLPPQRQEQLDAALARAGKKLLAVRDGASITSDVVRDALLDHGQLFSANPKVTPPDFFRTAAGRLEVHDDRSVFFPNDGSPPVRSTTPSASAPKPLTSEQVQALVKQVGAAPEGGRLNAAQVSGLTAALGFPNQRLAQASAGLSTEPRAVTIHPGGGATVRFTGGELYLGPQGQILSESPATSRERASAANPVALTVAIVAAGASVLLAIFLIVAGAFVFRDAPGRSRGRRLHRIWAAVKIPVALAAALGLWWMFASFLDAAAVLPRGAVGRMSRWVRAAQWPVFG